MKNDIKKLYDKSNIVKVIINIILVLNIIMSFIVVLNSNFNSIWGTLNIILTILYILLLNIYEMSFVNYADHERRKLLIEKSLEIDVTEKED